MDNETNTTVIRRSEFTYICFFVDLASWEVSSLQTRKARIAPCGRESLDRLQIVGVRSLHNLWRRVEYETSLDDVTGPALVQDWHSIGTGLVPAGRRKKTKNHLAPAVNLGN